MACVSSESIRPPCKTKYHEEHSVRPTTLEIIEREVFWEWPVGWRPGLAGGGLDGEPPLNDLPTEALHINSIATCEVPAVFHKHSNFCRLISRRQSETRGLWQSNESLANKAAEEKRTLSHLVRITEPCLLSKEKVDNLTQTQVVRCVLKVLVGGLDEPVRPLVLIHKEERW